MSNDPNRRIQQDRSAHENRTHHTMETVKIERGIARLPGWQRVLIFLAVLVVIGLLLLIAVS